MRALMRQSIGVVMLGYIEEFLALLATKAKQPIGSFCTIETADDKRTLVSSDGSLVSFIRIDGLRHVMGSNELDQISEAARMSLAHHLDKSGHAVQVFFSRDPDRAHEDVKRILRPARETARRLNLHLDDLLAEKERWLPHFLAWEATYMVLWTRPLTMSKAELSQHKQETKENTVVEIKGKKGPAKQHAFPPSADAQWMFRVAESMRPRHAAFVSSILSDLETLEFRAERMSAPDALVALREVIYPATAGSSWRPYLPGDKLPARWSDRKPGDSDASALLWPQLADQIFTQSGRVLTPSTVEIGDLIFSGVDMSLAPEQVEPFSLLISRLSDGTDAIPWRISILIEGGGLEMMSFKRVIAALMKFTSPGVNGQIVEGISALQAASLRGETPVRLRISMATWAPNDNPKLLARRAALLARGLEAWGHCQAGNLAGDPMQCVMSSALGLDVMSTAPAAAAPLSDVVRMLPWGRASSPWTEGAVLFRTPDGKPWPFEPGSSLFTAWIDLFFAPPGGGKSVTSNAINLALCLSPAATGGAMGAKLPYIRILDIGPSSSGLISLLREALPPQRRHEALYARLQMIPEHSINVFDTQLGCRRPMPLERAFLTNFLALLAAPVGQDAPYDGIADMVQFVIDEVYRLFDDTASGSSPRPYESGIDAEVDAALRQANVRLPDNPVWWEVVDALHQAGLDHAGGLAQRRAVPVLSDVLTAVRARQITDLFEKVKTGTQETAITTFMRMISSAIKAYPILSTHTRFDIGDSRVVALDLDQVAPRGEPGSPAARQTAIMYMLGRQVLGKDFYLNSEVLPQLPEAYRAFHAQRIQELRQTPKRFCYDEFHRASASMNRAQVKIDIREGRKWGVQIALASQLLDDFDDAMVDQSTSIFIMGAGSEKSIGDVAARFKLSETAQWIMRHRLNGPGPSGAPFLVLLRLKDGRHEQMLFNTLGPIELWSFSTTAEDAEIRNRLYRLLGPEATRSRLAQVFPGGSAKREIEQRLASLFEQGQGGDKADETVLESIIKEIAAGTGVAVGVGQDRRPPPAGKASSTGAG
jgi:intracellular multiplication protein IcmB